MSNTIKINFSYLDHNQYFTMDKYDTVKSLKNQIEKELDFKLTNFKIFYKKSNLFYANENLLLNFYFSDADEVQLIIEPKSFVEKKHLKEFEEHFNSKNIAEDHVKTVFNPKEEKKEIPNIDKYFIPLIPVEEKKEEKEPTPIPAPIQKEEVKSPIPKSPIRNEESKMPSNDFKIAINNVEVQSKPVSTPQANILNEKKMNSSKFFTPRKSEAEVKEVGKTEKPSMKTLLNLDPGNKFLEFVKLANKTYFCNMDKKNFATYICTKCKLYWCDYCMKFEPHKTSLVQLKVFKNYCLLSKDKITKDIGENIIKDPFYPNLEKLDLILSDKIEEIDKHYKTWVDILTQIKESQNKFLVNLYYNQVKSKNYANIKNDLKIIMNKVHEYEQIFQEADYEYNIDYLNYFSNFKKELIDIYSEYKSRYGIFQTISDQINSFNKSFTLQLEAKLKQNNEIKIDIANPEKLAKGLKEIEDLRDNLESSNIKHQAILKLNYYNSIIHYDHFSKIIRKVNDFDDRCEFKVNYQNYCGNIFLNHNNKLFILTGVNYNFFYFYDLAANEVFRLNNLNENHCRGSMIYIKSLNAIVVVSGKFNRVCEMLKLEGFNNPEPKPAKNKIDYSKIKGEVAKAGLNNNLSSNLNLSTISDLGDGKQEESNKKNKTGFFGKNSPTKRVAEQTRMVKISKPIDNTKLVWELLPELNYQRTYSSLYIHNEKNLYSFFGYSNAKGSMTTIERIDITQLKSWEIVNFQNPMGLDLKIDSCGTVYANNDEVYILGGSVNAQFSDSILKYNLTNSQIFRTELKIPRLVENNYFRFWEESNFQHITDFNKDFTDNDYVFAMFDARDKVHLFNVRTFKYEVI